MPLQKVASGGELSRVMLAIKTVLADKDAVGTMIFDEIDVGISGRTAQKVSEKMAVIARSRQVICHHTSGPDRFHGRYAFLHREDRGSGGENLHPQTFR
ncbi:MAG: hypothetical protein ACLR6B_08580 [Blautia sp.]